MKFVAALASLCLFTSCASNVSRRFDAAAVTTVLLRAAHASEAVVREQAAPVVEVTGTPRGGARGYHPPDPMWRETPASRWGLDFVARRYGNVLVVSTKNEIRYIHHGYYLDSLVLTVPEGVTVQRIDRDLTGSGDPDLSPPP
ncbi:MAG: hypothetical protein AMXMBFR36_21090 [Acidobacteriota bacterium]